MNPETNLIARSLGHQLSELETAFEDSFNWPDPHVAFARFVLEPTTLWADEEKLQIPKDRLGDTPVLSSCGYLIALANIRGEEFPLVESWHDHVKRRLEQKIVSRKRHSFFFRSYDLLGIALGLHHLDAKPEISVLKEAMQGGHSHYQDATLTRQIVAATAAWVTEADWNAPSVSVQKASLEALSLSYWLRSAGKRYSGGFTIDGSCSDVAIQILNQTLRQPVVPQNPEVQHVAIVYYALDEIISNWIERFELGFRSQERRSELEEQEQRGSQALRSVEKVKARIEKKGGRVFIAVRVLASGVIALPLAVLELYLVGVFRGLQDPFSISELPSKLVGYLSGGWIPIIVSLLLFAINFVPLYLADKTTAFGKWCGGIYECWLRSRWL